MNHLNNDKVRKGLVNSKVMSNQAEYSGHFQVIFEVSSNKNPKLFESTYITTQKVFIQ